MERNIRPFAAGELAELSLLAQRLNARRETGSTFCCARAEDIRRDFAETMAYSAACWEDGRPRGLLSCLPGPARKNADCSLLLDAQGAAYQSMAQALTAAVRERLGPDTACTFFFPAENGACRRFLEGAGAQRQVNEYILRLERGAWTPPRRLAAEPRPLQAGEREAFAALHDGIFPDAYASGRDILADGRRAVYTVPGETGPAAYGVLKTPGGRLAVVEMVGVRAEARRRGFGRAVLNHLIQEAFSRAGTEVVELVVDADNENALRLYRDTGFRVWQENNCFILR